MKVSTRHEPRGGESSTAQPVARFYHEKRQIMMVKIKPGEVYVSSRNELITTNLGSCIAACIWDPELSIGGMNHLMLSHAHENTARNSTTFGAGSARTAKYGDVAMGMLIAQLIERGAMKHRLKVKLFGGGQVMGQFSSIGHDNVVFALQYIKDAGLSLMGSDLGGQVTRQLMFEPTSGRAWVRRFPAILHPAQARAGASHQSQPRRGCQDKEISAC
ncbi:chemotaxis protein CheD [Photobacterium sp. TY1-4]|uniref:chemotaxis protein CheD n=1 Tax=Photobacterium sp. TY1-4 TaxID=2899122 RepID=UPI0021BE2D03|nr:chemotaxis protein CheD [Photobacterium sp. TY1-4]UXI03840.1 chemotaxis protein CheD [Photobacterium sp. TY1-4]